MQICCSDSCRRENYVRVVPTWLWHSDDYRRHDEASTEHTTLYPPKSDACSTCEVLCADLRSNEQILRRHWQQTDQTFPRLQAIADHVAAVDDLGRELKAHALEASRACNHHKVCVKDATDIYKKLYAKFKHLMSWSSESTEDPSAFAAEASEFWFHISSDYQ